MFNYLSTTGVFIFRFCRREEQLEANKKSSIMKTVELKDGPSNFGMGSKMNRSHSTPDLAQVQNL